MEKKKDNRRKRRKEWDSNEDSSGILGFRMITQKMRHNWLNVSELVSTRFCFNLAHNGAQHSMSDRWLRWPRVAGSWRGGPPPYSHATAWPHPTPPPHSADQPAPTRPHWNTRRCWGPSGWLAGWLAGCVLTAGCDVVQSGVKDKARTTFRRNCCLSFQGIKSPYITTINSIQTLFLFNLIYLIPYMFRSHYPVIIRWYNA
jgi:hypothetical protein